MHNQEQGVVISWGDYYGGARSQFLQECCVSEEQIRGVTQNNQSVVVELRTRGEANVVGSYPDYNRLYKHVFLQNPVFKKEVVDYYRSRGVGWVDIVALNRFDWKIFLFPKSEKT